MNNNTYLGYLRVSTERQGAGVSLQEQRAAIERYAEDHELTVIRWVEERQTAAKVGRPKFDQLLAELKDGKANGVILHKIDRGARNLRDWVDLMDLLEQGLEVHLAGDSLDLGSRGGRLAADIQAVVAADYIRNLREEAKKGIYGRLKQGLYPLPAPLGYLDKGRGKVKIPNGDQAQLVREAFELYSHGGLTLRALATEMASRGLRNRRGSPVRSGPLAEALRNPWYFGTIRIRRSGQTFPGRHLPLVTEELFDRVQLLLARRGHHKLNRHQFLFRQLLTCGVCNHMISGELHEGHVYYRCHSKSCKGTSLREEALETQVLQRLNSRSAAAFNDYVASKADGRRALVASVLGRLYLGRGQSHIQLLVDQQNKASA